MAWRIRNGRRWSRNAHTLRRVEGTQTNTSPPREDSRVNPFLEAKRFTNAMDPDSKPREDYGKLKEKDPEKARLLKKIVGHPKRSGSWARAAS